MKKPARKKRGGSKSPPAVVLQAIPSSTNQVEVKTLPSGPRGGKPKIELTSELAAEICHRVAHGGTVTRLGEDLPGHTTIFRWREEFDWFACAYARAIEDRHEYWAAQVKEIAFTPELGVKTERQGVKGLVVTKVIEGDMIEHRRLKVDTLKWLLSKLSNKFKDKVDVNHGGQPDGVPIKTEAVITAVDPVEAMRQYQEMMFKKKD
jgi:hypothetical protein